MVLLAFPFLFCCCSRTLARPMAVSILSRLEIQIAQPSVFLSSTGIAPGGSTQHSFQRYCTFATFTGLAPAGWPFRARGSEQGLAAWSLAMIIHDKNMLLRSSKQVFLLHHPVFCPTWNHPSLVWWWHCLVSYKVTAPSGSVLCSSRLPPKSVLKQQGEKNPNQPT